MCPTIDGTIVEIYLSEAEPLVLFVIQNDANKDTVVIDKVDDSWIGRSIRPVVLKEKNKCE